MVFLAKVSMMDRLSCSKNMVTTIIQYVKKPVTNLGNVITELTACPIFSSESQATVKICFPTVNWKKRKEKREAVKNASSILCLSFPPLFPYFSAVDNHPLYLLEIFV